MAEGNPGLENTAGSASVLCIIQYYYYTLYNTHCIILLRYWEEKRKKTAKKGSSRAKTPTCTRRLGARRDDHSRPWLSICTGAADAAGNGGARA